MNITQILKEVQLSDITIGFEIECVLPSNSYVNRKLQDVIQEYGVDVDDDHSIRPDGKYEVENTFEFKIGEIVDADDVKSQMRATPENIIKCAKFVYELFLLGAYTNDSCGLHAHFGIGELNKLSNLQNVWFTVYMIQSGLLKKKYKKFKGYPLFDPEYARFDNVSASVKELTKDLNKITDTEAKVKFLYHSLITRRNFEKYSALFPHSQGTIEWRGLRGILDGFIKEDYNTILDFFKLAASFAKDISTVLNSLDKIEVAGIKLKQVTDYAQREGVPSDKLAKKTALNLIRTFNLEQELEKLILFGMLKNKYFTQRFYRDPDIEEMYTAYFTKVLTNSSPYINKFYSLFDKKIDVRFVMTAWYQEVIIGNFKSENQTYNLDKSWADAVQNNLSLNGTFKNTNFIIKDVHLVDNLHKLLTACTIISSVFYVSKKDTEYFLNSDFWADFDYLDVQEYD